MTDDERMIRQRRTEGTRHSCFVIRHSTPAVPFFAAAIPPLVRAKMLLAILGIVALGIWLIAMVILGGIAVKRRARHRLGPSQPLDDAWYKRPLQGETPRAGGVTGEPDEAAGDED